ncbi:uncharacterized protein LOC111694360 [Trichogramma pretiosum]|uniref:uncharacterized protein LOC111694360 n=1 Tax=Trichogramma pretiosum TaxID=7493 RepID=UPI000C71ABC1|nr:uncharacterized protein LOC111694360 [Trichogramma pretiosum]
MTFKALINKFHDASAMQPVERYHPGHYESSHGWKGKGGGGGNSGAALSALTLLAFLFLVNVMQQSLMENNINETTTQTTIFLRDEVEPISLTSRQDEEHSVEVGDTDFTEESVTTEQEQIHARMKITSN